MARLTRPLTEREKWLSGLRSMERQTRGLRASDASVDRRFDRWNFEHTGHVATRGVTDVADRVCCLGDGRVCCPRPGHNGYSLNVLL
jgi:hypothetical protein